MSTQVADHHGSRSSAAPRLLAGIIAAGLAACSAVPAPTFHSLMPAAATAGPRISATGALAWEVLPVTIPAQVDQPQWVVQAVDGSLAVLEQQRWIAPLGAEIGAAVSERLTQLVGAPAAGSVAPAKQWRIQVEVQRFDAAPGRETRLEARWSLRSAADGAPTLSCRGEFVQAVSAPGYLALAKGHQQGVAQLGDAIGRALKAISAGNPATCEG